MRVLALLAKYEQHEDVWWRVDGEYAPVTFIVNCNDLFFWACADAELITDENIAMFEQAYKDASEHECGECYAGLLFCCRERKMRPQGAYYESFPKSMWGMFDECGPDRDKEKGNTQKPKLAKQQ